MSGDTVVIQVKRQPSGGAESNRIFTPRRIHLRLAGQDGPWVDHRYEIWDGGNRLSPENARTDSDGVVFQLVGPNVETVTLKVWFYWHETPHEFQLTVDRIPDVGTPEGLLIRMTNLGAGCVDAVEPHHIAAVQRMLGMPETGVADDAFLSRVLDRHGG